MFWNVAMFSGSSSVYFLGPGESGYDALGLEFFFAFSYGQHSPFPWVFKLEEMVPRLCPYLSQIIHYQWQQCIPPLLTQFLNMIIKKKKIWVIFQYVKVPCPPYLFICTWVFRLLSCVNSTAVDLGMHLSFLNYDFSQGMCPVVGLLGHLVVLFLVF